MINTSPLDQYVSNIHDIKAINQLQIDPSIDIMLISWKILVLIVFPA